MPRQNLLNQTGPNALMADRRIDPDGGQFVKWGCFGGRFTLDLGASFPPSLGCLTKLSVFGRPGQRLSSHGNLDTVIGFKFIPQRAQLSPF